MLLPSLIIAALTSLETPAVKSDSIRSVDTRKVVVYAVPTLSAEFNGVPTTSVTSVDDLMRQGTATLITRAAMAGEAMVRGLRGGQVALTVDGMKIHSACIDKMDPATAYVELDNLSALELSTGSGDLRYGANLGGALAFRMQRPEFDRPLFGAAELLYDANGAQRRARVDIAGGTEEYAARAGYTYRASDDYLAGTNQLLDGSNFEKHNAAVGFSWQTSEDHSVSLQGIYDLATFIGYPALLMDTRRAEGLIGAVTWNSEWSASVKSRVKLYANHVDHAMDDYSRSVEEVNSRPFMPGMYMPMDGTSFTTGLLAEASYVVDEGIVNATLDLSTLSATATMRMEPIDTSVSPMTMTNIGDAFIGTFGVNVSWEQPLSDEVNGRITTRLDVSPRTLRDEQARSVLSGYVPNADFDRTMVAFSLSADIRYQLSEVSSFTASISTMERLPTHLEAYGFWLYDPQSNFIVNGNPNLSSERAWGADASYSWKADEVNVGLTLHGQMIDRYIATKPDGNSDPAGNDLPLRSTQNVGWVAIGGIDVKGAVTLSPILTLGAFVSYLRGYALDQVDNLPMIPPLNVQLRAIVGDPSVNAELRLRFAGEQPNVSFHLQPEDQTASWFVADLLGSWSVNEHLTLRASLTNIFDTLYNEHTSINNMPSRGRSFMLTIRTSW